MPRFPTRYLLLSSILILFAGCAYHRYAHPHTSQPLVITNDVISPLIPQDGKSVKYKASIDVLNKHFSGIILLKQMDSVKHFVFITELGMKMFDFEMKNNRFTPVYVFEPLNNPKLIGALTHDFETLLLLDLYGKSGEYNTCLNGRDFLRIKEGDLVSIVEREGTVAEKRTSFVKKRKDTQTTYTSSDKGPYEHIALKQYGLVKIYIDLTKLNDE
ncbi:MAG: hypothetical protein JST26_09260 [Bacteroidetes bacterium]|nr:hypothetical protein [Bacteroidota bacterium]